MPLIGRIAFFAFAVITTLVAYAAASLRPTLQGRQPCRQWFAFLVGMLAAALVFTAWIGVYGLGAAAPGPQGAAFGFFAGLIWGGVFSYVNSLILWRAFDPPTRDYEREQEVTMNTDVGVLFSRGLDRLRRFRPVPGFAAAGWLPWTIFLAAIVLPAMWAYAFCQLTWLTEGAPGVEPALPIDR